MTGFTKLFSSITTSSIWMEDHTVLRLWIALLASCGPDGTVAGSRTAFAHHSKLTVEEFDHALNILTSPDPESRTPDCDGRRVEVIQGGWYIINYLKYREMRNPEKRREQVREAVARYRGRNDVIQCNPDVIHGKPRKAQAEAEAEAEAEEETTTNTLPPPAPRTASAKKSQAWKTSYPEKVLEVTGALMEIWPDQSKRQPKAGECVPRSSAPKLASNLSLIQAQGGDLDICLAIGQRFVGEYRAGGVWAKAAENWFGRSEDAPWQSYYQAHITNQEMSA